MTPIQPYHPKNLPEIRMIWRKSATSAYPFLSAEFIQKEENQIAQIYLPLCQTWVWKNECGSCLAFISLLENEIGGLFVLPEFQYRGIGKELVKHASQSFQELFVEVFSKNQSGILFYEKMGFSFFEEKIHEETEETLIRMVRLRPW
ncbi:GNAT family N-acetyltransferase [Lunatimonas salinarum]|uniref:GNAT family N-acetyltransferase n=1 Tax=Lunatimonas salinarum TaxID=1774590 RepID=UPI001ADFDC5C|nr:GNAT family N-acetyltransferase [Lunatimonas salinarum]